MCYTILNVFVVWEDYLCPAASLLWFLCNNNIKIMYICLQVALCNHVTSSSMSKPLPLSLKQYSVDKLTPDSQCFMFFTLDSASLYVCMWSSGNSSMIELSSHVRCDVIDYAYLTQQCAIEPFQTKVQLTVGDTTAVSCVTKPIAVRFGPAVGHTLAVSAQLWAQAYHGYEREGDTTAFSDEFQVLCDPSVCKILLP